MKNTVKLEIIIIIQDNIEVLHRALFNLRYSMLKNVLIDFHNGSNYDYHFMIKVLAKEFNEQFTCLGENTEKDITFAVPIEKKVTRIDKNGEEITRSVLYIAIY